MLMHFDSNFVIFLASFYFLTASVIDCLVDLYSWFKMFCPASSSVCVVLRVVVTCGFQINILLLSPQCQNRCHTDDVATRGGIQSTLKCEVSLSKVKINIKANISPSVPPPPTPLSPVQNLPFASEIELKPAAPGELPLMTGPLSATGDRDMRLEVPELAGPPRRHQSPLEEGEREPDADMDDRSRYGARRAGWLGMGGTGRVSSN